MGDKLNNSVDIDDQDIDFEYTIEALAEQHKDFVVERKHGLVVDYMATKIEGDNKILGAHYILVDIDHEDNKHLGVELAVDKWAPIELNKQGEPTVEQTEQAAKK